MQLINASPDLFFILKALKIEHKERTNSHCSAIVRVTPDLSNLYTSQSAWFEYNSMLRIYKY